MGPLGPLCTPLNRYNGPQAHGYRRRLLYYERSEYYWELPDKYLLTPMSEDQPTMGAAEKGAYRPLLAGKMHHFKR